MIDFGKMRKLPAFTMAEVLITLAIIGVIAAILIPAILLNHRSREIEVAKNKVNGALAGALNLMLVNEGALDNWSSNPASFFSIYSQKLRLLKTCDTGAGCWSTGNVKDLFGQSSTSLNSDTSYYKGIFLDGMSFAYKSLNQAAKKYKVANQAVYGYLLVDVNGNKGPGKANQDVVGFWVTNGWLVPMHEDDLTQTVFTNCSSNKTNFFKLSCSGGITPPAPENCPSGGCGGGDDTEDIGGGGAPDPLDPERPVIDPDSPPGTNPDNPPGPTVPPAGGNDGTPGGGGVIEDPPSRPSSCEASGYGC